MAQTVDQPTEAFLERAAEDYRWLIGRAGRLIDLQAGVEAGAMQILATVRVGGHEVSIRGDGSDLVEAYAQLCRRTPERLLGAAFREYVTAR